MSSLSQQLAKAREHVRTRYSEAPEIGLILGSGLAGLAAEIDGREDLPFREIPFCPPATVPGHPGTLTLGGLSGKRIAALVGRLHLYEGYSANEVVFPVRLLAALGCHTLLVTNAAGGLNPLFWPGDLMAITDHINLPGLAGISPLAGSAGLELGERFVDLKDAYDPALVELAIVVGHELGLELRRGVYAMVPGPSYETPAEIRMLQAFGADAVGMSTVLEVLAARQLGLRVMGVSCITNLATAAGGKISHEQVLSRGLATGPLLASVIREVVRRI